ncbi:MAG: hypothetical protein ACNA8O_04060 [Cyanobacteriota bacterium]|jgi:hypothetical protein
MTLSHCPLCLALAVLSTVRGLSLAVLVWRLIVPARRRGPVLLAAALQP